MRTTPFLFYGVRGLWAEDSGGCHGAIVRNILGSMARIMPGAIARPAVDRVQALCDGLASSQARIKYGSAKQLLRISEENPGLLQPHFELLVRVMEGEARILRWNATRILAHLARVDSECRIDGLLDRYLAPIGGDEMIAAANTIQGAADIALAKPYLADRIARAIVEVQHANYQRPECRQVAAGHAIQALDRFFHHVQRKEVVLAFVAAQLESSRPATRKKAERFVAKWNRRTINS